MQGLFKNVLCAVDFDEHCGAVIETACSVLDPDGLLHIFHALRLRFALTRDESEFPVFEAKERLERIARAQLDGRARYEILVETSDNTVSSILEAASRLHHGCIVIATHARKGLDRFLLGSVAEQVVRQCSWPVITIGPQVERVGRT